MARPGRSVVMLLVGAAVLALAAFAVRYWSDTPGGNAVQPVTDAHLADLRQRIDREAAAADDAVASYRPRQAGRLDDLTVPVDDIFRGLPGVVAVEVPVRPARLSRRIIHLRDLHLVPRDLFALDVRQAAGRPLSDADIDKLYEQHLLETELVQIEQMILLRSLARHHGLCRIRIEGLTVGEEPLFRNKVEALKGLEQGEVASARVQLREVRVLLRVVEAAGRKDTDRYGKAVAIEKQLLDLLDQQRPRLLEVGAAGRLLMAGEIDEVLALDDRQLLEAAKPITPDGRVRFDAEKVRAREDAQVRAALDDGPCSLIVLGGAHDLSDSVRRVAGGDCEYVRVRLR